MAWQVWHIIHLKHYMIYYRCSTTGHLVYQYHNLLMHLFLFWRDMAWGEDFDLSKTPHQNAHFGPMSVQNPHSGTNRHYSVFILIVILPIKIPIRDKKKKKKEKKKDQNSHSEEEWKTNLAWFLFENKYRIYLNFVLVCTWKLVYS